MECNPSTLTVKRNSRKNIFKVDHIEKVDFFVEKKYSTELQKEFSCIFFPQKKSTFSASADYIPGNQ